MKTTNSVGNSIWIIAPFSYFDLSSSSLGRFLFIAKTIRDAGSQVTFFSSSFDHLRKRKKFKPKIEGIKLVFIHEPGYSKNVSIRRILSHIIFSLNLFLSALAMITLNGPPNCIYCTIPHNFGAALIGAISKCFGIKFIIDVHDTWPENVLSVYKLKPWQIPFYYLWKCAANCAIRLADCVFAESRKYAQRADNVRIPLKKSSARCVYIGGDITYYSEVKGSVQLPPNLEKGFPRFVYVGSLGANYDLELVIRAFSRLQQYCSNAWLVFLGGGDRELELRKMAKTLNINAWFSGFINHHDLVSILRKMDYGINSFAAGGNVAYSYKVNDYLLAGIPVINSLPGEVSEFIDQYKLGFNYEAGNADELLYAMRCACNTPKDTFTIKIRRFSSSNLDWSQTYQPIFKELIQF